VQKRDIELQATGDQLSQVHPENGLSTGVNLLTYWLVTCGHMKIVWSYSEADSVTRTAQCPIW